MKLVKIVGLAEQDIDDIVDYTPCLLRGDNCELVMLQEEWEDISEQYSFAEVNYFEV